MSIQQISVEQAKEILDKGSDAIYVDVRSIPEFVAGHAAGAINIPLLHRTGGQMIPNPDFQKVAEKVLPRDKKLLVGCQMGGRSQKACEVLQKIGFENLHNIQGGFGGARDPFGNVIHKGWQESGLPVSTDNSDGVSYDSLFIKTNKK